jgi:hypothetical protein
MDAKAAKQNSQNSCNDLALNGPSRVNTVIRGNVCVVYIHRLNLRLYRGHGSREYGTAVCAFGFSLVYRSTTLRTNIFHINNLFFKLFHT